LTKFSDIFDSPLSVVCNDAGAANLIVNWLDGYKHNVFPCMEGPAKKIWNSKFPNSKLLALDVALEKSRVLLSGTGWSSNLEHNARVQANMSKMTSIAVIDHWTNYKERFIRNTKEVLPDSILVSDKYAMKKASDIFPCVKILELENVYLNNESKSVLSLRDTPVNTPPRKILAVMEPFREEKNIGDSLEFASMKYLISNLTKITKDKRIEICLRMHPSEPIGKYDYFVNKYTNIKISSNLQLHSDLVWADLVVGMQSFAMVVSQHCNIPTVSILPPDSIECILPYREILSLRDL
jgi:hypothetical protein